MTERARHDRAALIAGTVLGAGIVAEATHCYAAGGYAGLSFGTVAERVGIKKATLFHYFPTKDALVHAVFDALGATLESRSSSARSLLLS